jgi:hypothetical protein
MGTERYITTLHKGHKNATFDSRSPCWILFDAARVPLFTVHGVTLEAASGLFAMVSEGMKLETANFVRIADCNHKIQGEGHYQIRRATS